MRFFMPTRVFAERNCVINHAEELGGLGTRALIVTGGKSSKANGALDDVTAALGKTGCVWSVFDEVEENPSVETVMRAAAAGIGMGADFVIGVGGGSPLDAAKAAALMTANPDKGSAFLCKGGEPHSAPLPLAAVPTTCGTGSEVTGVSVLTYHERRTKGSIPFRIFPQLALCDGRYLAEAPMTLIVNTALDALAHLVESRLHSSADTFSLMCAESGLVDWGRHIGLLRGERRPTPDELDSLLAASSIAGMAIAQTGTGIPHGLSYALTYEAHIPHGRACAVFLPGFIAESGGDGERVLRLAGFKDIGGFKEFIRRTAGSVPDKELLKLAAESLLRTPAKLGTATFAADGESVMRIALSAAE
ncbi:MAG: iron-containing alcohol dehydrogenase [Ruminococcus sp.]|nr:iron-containing alcohol dehydrogenase [Ruminococcus sp.]